MAEQVSFKRRLASALFQGAMAMGEGMTGRPFLSNWREMQSKEAEREFKKYQQEKLLAAGVPVYTFDSEGGVQQVASVPKGSRIVPPAQMITQEQKDIGVQNVKREIYSKDLTTFFAVDDVLQQARGQGLGRLGAGGKMTWAGIKQDTPLGQAVASHEAARKRLRVQLVRAAGDVGNINIVEQKAAEMMIPTQWDAADTATLKRAYLQQIGQAINNNDGNAVKNVIGRFMGTPVFQSNLEIIKHKGKTYKVPKDEVADFKKAKGIK